MKKVILAAALAFSFGSVVHAETSIGKDVKEATQDAGKAVKKGVRKVKDETCEMVNGKMECAAKKVKHKIQNGVDEVKDKAND